VAVHLTKSHILMCEAPDMLECTGSNGFCGEQGLEAWHGRNRQNAVKCCVATELKRAATFTRAIALLREVVADALVRPSHERRPSKIWARTSTEVCDKRRRENKPQQPECHSETLHAMKKRKQLATAIGRCSETTIGA